MVTCSPTVGQQVSNSCVNVPEMQDMEYETGEQSGVGKSKKTECSHYIGKTGDHNAPIRAWSSQIDFMFGLVVNFFTLNKLLSSLVSSIFSFPPPPLQSIVIHFPQTKMLGYGQTNQANLHKHNMQMTICKCQMENPELKPGSNKTMLKKLCWKLDDHSRWRQEI